MGTNSGYSIPSCRPIFIQLMTPSAAASRSGTMHESLAEAACADRVFLGTNDARLIALDLATGKPCAGFGSNGEIALPPDVPPLYRGELQIEFTPPTWSNDMVVVGSAVDDMSRARAPSGTVFAFDPRAGQKRWSFDPVPRRPDDPAAASWANGSYARSAG